jgi:hypothetical protein
MELEDLDESRDEAPLSGSGSGSINLSRRYENLVQKQMRLSGHESDGSEHNVSQHVNGTYEEVGNSVESSTSTNRFKISIRGQSDTMLNACSNGISFNQNLDLLGNRSYDRPPNRRSNYSDYKAESRLSMKSSEQELSSYFENSQKSNISVRRSPIVWSSSDRPSSTNSLPAVSQKILPPDHRSLTPEIRLNSGPNLITPLRTMRTTPISSGNSSRTVTPVVAYDPVGNILGVCKNTVSVIGGGGRRLFLSLFYPWLYFST